MTKQYGYKNGEDVAGQFVRMLLDGRIRPGERLDRNALAELAGVSRAPVQEAVLRLEQEGLVTTRYHRGAFVEAFDADAVRDHYAVWGLLNGEAAARAAAQPTPALDRELAALLARMETCDDGEEFDALGFEFRRQINAVVAGPRLRATLRGFLALMPETFRLIWPDHMRVILPYYRDEARAIARGHPRAARDAEQSKAAAMGELVIGVLSERGVLRPDTSAEAIA
jgi:DNA-binding GntR family transcriptional regulator